MTVNQCGIIAVSCCVVALTVVLLYIFLKMCERTEFFFFITGQDCSLNVPLKVCPRLCSVFWKALNSVSLCPPQHPAVSPSAGHLQPDGARAHSEGQEQPGPGPPRQRVSEVSFLLCCSVTAWKCILCSTNQFSGKKERTGSFLRQTVY